MINPWSNFEKSDFLVHPDDRSILEYHNKHSKPQHQFLTHLAPEPWIGNIEAPIVVLLANPGATNLDVKGREQPKASAIISKSISNLRQESVDYPHFFFNPELSETAGQAWYFKAFKSLLQHFDTKHLAKNVLTCEMAPYHSKNWKKPSNDFPTQKYTNYLVKIAIQRNAIILMHRARKLWLAMVPELERYPLKYVPSSWQSPAISPRNYKTSFESIRSRLEECR